MSVASGTLSTLRVKQFWESSRPSDAFVLRLSVHNDWALSRDSKPSTISDFPVPRRMQLPIHSIHRQTLVVTLVVVIPLGVPNVHQQNDVQASSKQNWYCVQALVTLTHPTLVRVTSLALPPSHAAHCDTARSTPHLTSISAHLTAGCPRRPPSPHGASACECFESPAARHSRGRSMRQRRFGQCARGWQES